MTDRVKRVQEALEQPLLVTNPINVKYLVGFDSSNCALVLERDRVRLLTDFRYIAAAREVEGVEVVETKRDTIGALGETLSGQTVSFEPLLPWSLYERLRGAGVELTPAEPVVERLRAVKDEQELAIIRLKVPDASEQLARQVVSAVQKIRALELRKAPSISESLDWARALVLLNADHLDAALVESTLTLVVKHERDLERVKANLDKVLADS